MKYTFSIMRLTTEHLDEICEDIRYQYRTGIASMPLFLMPLVPEGKQPVDKAAILCEKYDKFRNNLEKDGVPSGILVQSSIGHGWLTGERFPFQPFVGFDGKERNVVCPYDEGFRAYIYDALRTCARHKPKHIMIDDDLRLMHREGGGCTCTLHVQRFRELSGLNVTREELAQKILSDDPAHDKWRAIFRETQKEALLGTAKVMRDAIDSVDETLPASYSCVGYPPEFGGEIGTILAGKHNKVLVRVNNAYYCQPGLKYFTWSFCRAASQYYRLEPFADVVLAETDTCPQTRYSTGAMSLHAHFTGSLLEGLAGAKHWITCAAYEPESGKAYRKVLAKYNGFYDKLTEIVPSIKWDGLRMPIFRTEAYTLRENWSGGDDAYNEWGKQVFEGMGLPMFFSSENEGVLCLEGTDFRMSKEELLQALSGTVLLASDSASVLEDMGLAVYTGVEVFPWEGKTPNAERILLGGKAHTTSVQKHLLALRVTGKGASVSSLICNTCGDDRFEELFPGCVTFHNALGGTVITFAGSPKAEFNIAEAFALLNPVRKRQFVSLLALTGHLATFYPGDEPVYCKCGRMPDGLVVTLFNLGYDPIEETRLYVEQTPTSVMKLAPDGRFEDVSFRTEADGIITLSSGCYTLDPVVFFIK